MRLLVRLAALALLPVLAAPAPAGKFNKKLDIGSKAPAWENLEGTDGKKHSLAELKDRDVVVVFFTCNSCVVAEAYEPRLVEFSNAHSAPDSRVGVVAINVNTGKDDALPAMKARAEKKKFPFVYLYDPSQEIAKAYGATYTPEFFVLDKDRKVVYMGAMDDKAPPGTPKNVYLEPAVKAALAGKPADTAETSPAAGCRIKFNKKADD